MSAYRTLITVLAFLGPLAGPTAAQWSQTAGPRGATFHSLAAVEASIVAGGTGGAVFRYDGAAWTPLTASLGALYTAGADLYADSPDGLARSRDGGRTFEPPLALPQGGTFLGVDQGRLFAAYDSTVFASDDEGSTWAPHTAAGWATLELGGQRNRFRTPLQDVKSAVTVEGGTVLAAASVYVFGDIYRLAPGDTAWTPLLFKATTFEGARRVQSLARFEQRLVALTSAGVFASLDEGETWDSLNTNLPVLDAGAEQALLVGRDALFLRVGSAFYRLADDGWHRMPDVPAKPYVLAASAYDHLYASDPDVVYRLDPTGWVALPRPVATTPLLRYASGQTAIFEVGGRPMRTDDGGTTFLPFAPSGPAGLRGLTFVTEHLVFARSEAGAVRSVDGGQTWAPLARPPAPAWLGTLPPGAPVIHGEAVYAAFGASWCVEHCSGNGEDTWGGIYRTTDGGATWTEVMAGLPMGPQFPASIRGLFSDGIRLFVETERGCVRGDGGAWTPAACPPGGFARYAADGTLWFALASQRVAISDDGGASWVAALDGLPLEANGHLSPSTFLISAPTGVVLVTETGGTGKAFRFTDGTWQPLPLSFPQGVRWASLAVGGGMLYGGAQGRGLWKTPVDALTSTERGPDPRVAGLGLSVPTPNPVREVATLVLSPGGPDVARVEVFDVLGRRRAVLFEGITGAVPLTLTLDATSLPPGLYFVRATAGGARVTRTVTVL